MGGSGKLPPPPSLAWAKRLTPPQVHKNQSPLQAHILYTQIQLFFMKIAFFMTFIKKYLPVRHGIKSTSHQGLKKGSISLLGQTKIHPPP